MSKLKELKEWFWNFGGERDSLKVMLIGSFFLFVSFIFLPISGHVASVLFYTFSFLSITINLISWSESLSKKFLNIFK